MVSELNFFHFFYPQATTKTVPCTSLWTLAGNSCVSSPRRCWSVSLQPHWPNSTHETPVIRRQSKFPLAKRNFPRLSESSLFCLSNGMVVSAIWDLPHVQFLFIYFKELLNETTLWDSENTDYKFFFFEAVGKNFTFGVPRFCFIVQLWAIPKFRNRPGNFRLTTKRLF